MRTIPLLLALGACKGQDSEIVYHPSVTFLAPADASTVAAGDVQVSIDVEDFVLAPPENVGHGHNEEGEPTGYCELKLDDAEVTQLSETQYTLAAVTAGAHTLACELYFVDGDELEPSVSESISFTAQ